MQVYRILGRGRLSARVGGATLLLVSALIFFRVANARADVFRADSEQVIPHTQGLTPGPGVDLSNGGNGLNLSYADLAGFDLTKANLSGANLSHAQFSTPQGFGFFNYSTLTDANLNHATITYTAFAGVVGLTQDQLSSTLSYTHHNLTGVTFDSLDLNGWNFASQNLAQASFVGTDLTNANLEGAKIQRAAFNLATGFTSDQIYSTASYLKKDLSGVQFAGLDLTGWNFAGQNLTGASFDSVTMKNVDISGALISKAQFICGTTSQLSFAQLQSTASYARHNLAGVVLDNIDASAWDLAGQNLSQALFRDATLTGTNFQNALISGADFGGAKGFTPQQLYSTRNYNQHNLASISFQSLALQRANFAGQNLSKAIFEGADLAAADLSSANLSRASFDYATLSNADFQNAIITNADFNNAVGFSIVQLASTKSFQQHNLTGIRLEDVNLSGWTFAGQNVTGADLSGATLTNTVFTGANIGGVTFCSWWTGTGGNNQLSLAQLQSTSSYAHRNLAGVQFEQMDLSGWDFNRQRLQGANFSFCTLTNADFSGAIIKNCSFDSVNGFSEEQLDATTSFRSHDLAGVNFASSDISGWNLAKQNLSRANFNGASLILTNFNSANLSHANFSDADARCADFTGANLSGTTWVSADLRNARGLSAFSKHSPPNVILPDGSVGGLVLTNGANGDFLVRDGLPLITVYSRVALSPDAHLSIDLDAAWNAPITFAPGIPIALGGELDLNIVPDDASMVGKTFHIFNWNTSLPATDTFDYISPDDALTWDVSHLYTDGTVTVTGVGATGRGGVARAAATAAPEPVTLGWLVPALFLLLCRRQSHPISPSPRPC